MDATGMNALESVVERMKRRHSNVILSGMHQQPLQMLRKAGFIEVIGRENLCATFDDALLRAKSLVSKQS
jgi:SulP family sulfate permease